MRIFIGWALDPSERSELLDRLPPRYANVVADHLTLAFQPSNPKLPTETVGEIVGEAADGQGVQAMVVRIGGTTDRPDGSTYHVTWSLADGRRAVESNTAIRDHGWRLFPAPIQLRLEPRLFKP